ncbi:MAG TPA: hypothetical protein VFU21_03400 [Kofleriaceae bacterium]|nr:hypothetical protein [Kofleriaceae bacterium]
MPRLTFERPTGWRRTYHRALQWIGAAVAALAIVATLLPWHEVRDSGLGDALGCAFLPDCHVTPTSREARMAAPPDAVHSGLDHGGVFLIGLLVLLVAARAASLRWPRPWLAALVGIHTLAIVVGFLTATLLMHMFDLTTERVGWYLLLPTTAALVMVGLADLASVAIVHLRRRGSDPVQVPPP